MWRSMSPDIAPVSRQSRQTGGEENPERDDGLKIEAVKGCGGKWVQGKIVLPLTGVVAPPGSSRCRGCDNEYGPEMSPDQALSWSPAG